MSWEHSQHLVEFESAWRSSTPEQQKQYAFNIFKKMKKLEKESFERSWELNPDRMGGSYTEEEKYRHNW